MKSAGKRWGRSPLRPAPAPTQNQHFDDDRNDKDLNVDENAEGGKFVILILVLLYGENGGAAQSWKRAKNPPFVARSSKASKLRKPSYVIQAQVP